MSEIKFIPFCGFCFRALSDRMGLVLSCGCFLCFECSREFTYKCPACKSEGVKSVKLDHPPPEVDSLITDAAFRFEEIFNLLKFQIQHYKEMLNKASGVVESKNRQINEQIKCC